MGPRIAVRVTVALVVMLLAALTLGPARPSSSEAAGATTAPCAPSVGCRTDGVSAAAPRPTAAPCLRSVSCGGGALLAGGGALVLAVLGVAVALVGPILRRRIAAAYEATSTGRLSAGRLYRPPRLSL